jgi:S1-C subfamily serine protease
MKKNLKVTNLSILLLLMLSFIVGCQGISAKNSSSLLSRNQIIARQNYVHSSEKNLNTVQDLQNTTVIIRVNKGMGSGMASGVISKRAGKVYVWTIAHVYEYQPMIRLTPEELDKKLKANEVPKLPEKVFGKVGDHANITMMYRFGDQFLTLGSDSRVIAISSTKTHDLALLELSIPAAVVPMKSVKWQKSKIRTGKDVYHVGHLRGTYIYSVVKGIISCDLRETRGQSFFQTDHIAIHGSSGGGVFDKETGACIGLMAWINMPGINFGIPFYRIRQFARENGYEWVYDHNLPIPKNMPKGHPEIPTDPNALKNVPDSIKKMLEEIRKSDK